MHTGDHARLHGRDGLAAGWGTGRISLPLAVARGVVSAARQNLGAAQAFPRPHGGFNEPWFGMMDSPWTSASGSAVETAGERTRVDRREGERCEGMGELPRLPLATLR